MRQLNSLTKVIESFRKSPFGPSVRTIYTDSLKEYFETNPKDNVLIIGGLAAVSALNSRVLKEPQYAQRITLASQLPWIGKVDPVWDKAPWGQNVNYLPEFLRDMATEELRLPLSHNLTFGEMKTITRHAYKFGKEHYKLIDERLAKVVQTSHQAHIHTSSNHDLVIPSNMVFNFARIPGTHFKNIPVHSAGELYMLPSGYIFSPICIDGMGQNALWIIRDFAGKRPIWIMISHDEKIRQDLFKEVVKANHAIKDSRLKCGILCLDHHFHPRINTEKDIISFQGINLLNHTPMTVDIPSHNVFGARGFKTDHHLITGHYKVDKQHPTYSDSKLKTIVPQGNLAALHTGIENFFGSDIINDYRDLGRIDIWQKRVKYHANALGLEIDQSFFDTLDEQFRHTAMHTIHDMWKLQIMVSRAFKDHVRVKQKDHHGKLINLTWQDFLIQVNQKPVEKDAAPKYQNHHGPKK